MNYVADIRDRIHNLHGAGLPMEDAASVLLREHHGAGLGLSERLAVLTATEYRHLDQAPEPLNLVSTLSTAVRLAPSCVPAQVPDRAALMAEFDASGAGSR